LAVIFENLVARATDPRPPFLKAAQDRKIALVYKLATKPHYVSFARIFLAFSRCEQRAAEGNTD
jgi:hypothetical protein